MSDDLIGGAVDAARERYIAEREKRLRTDGVEQYSILEGDNARFDHDPWAPPPDPRDALVEEVDAVVLGGGFSGMHVAIELKKHGVDSFRLIEKGSDFGGTWYWNRYPGCRCDVESYVYMPYLEETGYMPTEKYARAPEIFEHCQRIGKHFDLYPHALFQTEIQSASWQQDQQRWLVRTTCGDQLSARFLITAGGLLHKAKLPAIKGIETFQGKTFHTARWDYSYTGGSPTEPMTGLNGKRVGIIGTGATAVQAVPELARSGAEVFVFQRTPAAVGVRGNGPTDEAWFTALPAGWQRKRILNFTAAVSGDQPEDDQVGDGWTETMWHNTAAATGTPEEQARLDQLDFEVMQKIRDRVDAEVHDPATADLLKPWWAKHCKRVAFHDEYLAAFNEPNVHLIDTDGMGVHEVGAGGPIVDGTEYDLDLLIFASGFEVTTGYVRRLGFDPVGRDGTFLSERWHDGAHTLHGVHTAEFPNLLLVAIAQASASTNFVHFISEVTAHVAAVVARCQAEGIAEIEADPQAEEEWLHFLWAKGAASSSAAYNKMCTPSYMNNEGQMSMVAARGVVWPGNVGRYADHLAAWRAAEEMAGVKTVRHSET